MKWLICATVVLALAPIGSCQNSTESQMRAILTCIRERSSAMGAGLPRFDEQTIMYRFHFGKYTVHLPNSQSVIADDDNELRIAVYGPHENSAVIYNVFLEQQDGEGTLLLGHPSSFTKRFGKWIGHDNPGGTATEYYLKALLQSFSSMPAFKEPLTNLTIKPSVNSCQSVSQ